MAVRPVELELRKPTELSRQARLHLILMGPVFSLARCLRALRSSPQQHRRGGACSARLYNLAVIRNDAAGAYGVGPLTGKINPP
jgi:hypothetical protein